MCVFFYTNRSIVKCLVKHNKKCWRRKDREEACLYKVGERTDPRSVTILLSHSCVLFCLLRLFGFVLVIFVLFLLVIFLFCYVY